MKVTCQLVSARGQRSDGGVIYVIRLMTISIPNKPFPHNSCIWHSIMNFVYLGRLPYIDSHTKYSHVRASQVSCRNKSCSDGIMCGCSRSPNKIQQLGAVHVLLTMSWVKHLPKRFSTFYYSRISKAARILSAGRWAFDSCAHVICDDD